MVPAVAALGVGLLLSCGFTTGWNPQQAWSPAAPLGTPVEAGAVSAHPPSVANRNSIGTQASAEHGASPIRCGEGSGAAFSCSADLTGMVYGVAQTAAWRNISPSPNVSSPPVATGASMAFDPVDGYTVLSGGFGAEPYYYNDTWAFENGSWRQLHPTVSPSARVYSAMTWDAADGYILMFGGSGYTGNLNDTWEFLHGNWTELTPTVSPPARSEEGLTWDAYDGYVLMFGGYQDYEGSNDTWSFLGGQWRQLSPAEAPPVRSQVAMAYDPASESVVLLGGYTPSDGTIYNDTWSFSGGNWSQLEPATLPPARADANFAFFPAIQGLVLNGGYNSHGAAYSDTWWFRQGRWSNESAGASPGQRLLSGFALAPECDCLVLFGGSTTRSLPTGVWEYYALNLTVTASPAAGEAPLNVSFSATVPNDPLSLTINWAVVPHPQTPFDFVSGS